MNHGHGRAHRAAVGWMSFIAVIRMNPTRFPRVNAAGAKVFPGWLVSDEAEQLIKSFGVDQYGEPPFFPNADEWRERHPA
jgi:tungstate transport system substrate-binding protein